MVLAGRLYMKNQKFQITEKEVRGKIAERNGFLY
jgi:hypothetical protein